MNRLVGIALASVLASSTAQSTETGEEQVITLGQVSGQEVQDAIDGLPESSGTILLGPYDYSIYAPYRLGDNTTIKGIYGATRILLPYQARFNAVENAGGWFGNTHVAVQDLAIVGNQQVDGFYGIELRNVTRANVQNVTITGTSGGVMINGDNSGTSRPVDAVLHNVRATDCMNQGIVFRGVENVTATQCFAHHCGSQGFWGSNAHHITLNACIANENGEQGYMPSGGSTHWAFTGCIANDNIKVGFTLNDDGSDHLLSGCMASGNGNGVRIRASRTSIVGGQFNDNTEYGIYVGGVNPIAEILLSSCLVLGNGEGAVFVEEDVTRIVRGGLLGN